jgi:hypothetical protein
MRTFYIGWEICPTLSGELSNEKIKMLSGKSEIVQTLSAQLKPGLVTGVFPLPWSHYVRLKLVENPQARVFFSTNRQRSPK